MFGEIDKLLRWSAAPHEAQNAFEQFERDQKIDVEELKKIPMDFFRIFGNSRFLTRFILRYPESLNHYKQSPYQRDEKPLSQFMAEAEGQKNNMDLISSLKRYRYQEYIRLTIKELMGLDQHMIYREISHLARVIVQVVADHIFLDLLKRYKLKNADVGEYVLLAMGKLGGNELNYSSDIDVIGVYDEEKDLGALTTHEFYVKFFKTLGQVLTISDRDGFLYRVDWDLRPEGKAGTIANSINSLETYYTTFGKEWERQAFIKASPLWQTSRLSGQLMAFVRPFVYRSMFDEKTIRNVWDMKSKIVDELHQRGQNGVNIKLDEGGIRDIEFFVQGFQLLYGGKIKELRGRHTIEVLNKLKEFELVSPQRAEVLTRGYFFLRRLESALQMEEEQQVHTVKPDKQHKFRLARRLGIQDPEDQAVTLLDEQIFNVRNSVREIFREVYSS